MGIAPVLLLVISVTSPCPNATVTTPVHFVASADGAAGWTVTASNGSPLYKTANPSLDGWVVLQKGQHNVTVTANDAHGKTIGRTPLTINVQGVALPTPPASAAGRTINRKGWKPFTENIGGDAQNATIMDFRNPPPNIPGPAITDLATTGLHLRVASPDAASTNGLFAWSDRVPKGEQAPLNALWSFWFFVPSRAAYVQAYESDLVIVADIKSVSDVKGDSRRIFEFNTQYARVRGGTRWIW